MRFMARLVSLFVLMSVLNLAGAYGKVVRMYVGKLDINAASAADFTRLPGVGEVIAYRIVKEREKLGKFNQSKELQEISGISAHTFEGFKNYLCTEGGSNLRVYTDVNTITKPLLLGLPGMSEGEAQSILNYRKAKGAFVKIDDLLKVPGIDRKRFNELSEWLVVSK